MMKQTQSLLIGQPGPVRSGLRHLLMSIPQIREVSQADDVPSALCLGNEHIPYLVLLVVDHAGIQTGEALHQLQHKWPQARYVVMVDDEHDLQAAQAAGADRVVMMGCLVSKLIEAIESVLG